MRFIQKTAVLPLFASVHRYASIQPIQADSRVNPSVNYWIVSVIKSVTLSTMPTTACNKKDSTMKTDDIIGTVIFSILGGSAFYTLAYFVGLV